MYPEHIAKIAKMTVDQIISIGKRQLSYRIARKTIPASKKIVELQKEYYTTTIQS